MVLPGPRGAGLPSALAFSESSLNLAMAVSYCSMTAPSTPRELPVLLVSLEYFRIHPRFGGRATDGVVNQSDRHVARLVQVATKVITDCRERRHGFRAALFPLGLYVFRRRRQLPIGAL